MDTVASTLAVLPRVFIAWLIFSIAISNIALAQISPSKSPNIPAETSAQGHETGARTELLRATETPAVVIDGTAAETLLGSPVQSIKGEDLGRVVDVVVDRSGFLRAAIIDFGGFLGVGTRKIAIDWRALHFPDNGAMNKLVADLQRDQLRNAPVFKEGEPIVVIGAANPAPSAVEPPLTTAPPATPQASEPQAPAETPLEKP